MKYLTRFPLFESSNGSESDKELDPGVLQDIKDILIDFSGYEIIPTYVEISSNYLGYYLFALDILAKSDFDPVVLDEDILSSIQSVINIIEQETGYSYGEAHYTEYLTDDESDEGDDGPNGYNSDDRLPHVYVIHKDDDSLLENLMGTPLQSVEMSFRKYPPRRPKKSAYY